MIRSHNEVMLVIGVAEPDSGATDLQAERRLKRQRNEEIIGERLLTAGRFLEIGGVWGVNGLRQRILVSGMLHTVQYLDASLLTLHSSTANTRASLSTSCIATNVANGLWRISSLPGSHRF